MKNISPFLSFAAVVCSLFTATNSARAQGTAFTYQGFLTVQGAPANGSNDLTFTLMDAATSGSTVGASNVVNDLGVTNGLFTVTLDFGASFPGAARWLQIAVRPGNSSGAYTNVTPRQSITATPYAIFAGGVSAAGLTGTVPLAQLPAAVVTNGASGVSISGTFTGNGASLTALNAAQLTSGTVPVAALSNAWRIGGNAGTTPGTHFLGTADNQPLELKVNTQRGLRLEPTANTDTVNVIGGSARNSVGAGAVGATIGGGGSGDLSYTNRVEADFSTVSGGGQNRIQVNATFATIGGGSQNTIQPGANSATIGGGYQNTIETNASEATIGGGDYHRIQAGAFYSTIGGGDQNTIETNANSATIGGGGLNKIQTNANSATIGGGYQNMIQPNSFSATISGGYQNTIQPGAQNATISGGIQNTIVSSAQNATIGGGTQNTIQSSAVYSTIGGGDQNTIQPNASYATIPGGSGNTAGGQFSFAAGRAAIALHDGAFVWADSTGIPFGSSSPNQFLIRASGGMGINKNNPATALDVNGTVTATSFSGNGAGLTGLNAAGLAGTIPDGQLSANVSLLGASVESAEITDGTIAPADLNLAAFNTSFWRATGNAGTTPATHFLGTTDNQALEFRVNNQRGLRLEPNLSSPNLIGGYGGNSIGAGTYGSVIAGGGGDGIGDANSIGNNSGYSAIGGGKNNTIKADSQYAAIAGGRYIDIGANSGYSAIGGGYNCYIISNSQYATIAGGNNNAIATLSGASAIGGGISHVIGSNSPYSTIAGGNFNYIPAYSAFATIPGGTENVAVSYAFAAGRRAKANHPGAFVWADSTDADFASTANNQFIIRAAGGVRVVGGDITWSTGGALTDNQGGSLELGPNVVNIGSTPFIDFHYGSGAVQDYNVRLINNGDGQLDISSINYVTPMARFNSSGLTVNGTFVSASDRNVKENFAPVDARSVLEKVAALPITRWNYKADSATPHLGPMAQDFYAAFAVGPDDKHITTVDESGVALAAIQGLNEKVEETRAENAALKKELSEIKQVLLKLSNKGN